VLLDQYMSFSNKIKEVGQNEVLESPSNLHKSYEIRNKNKGRNFDKNELIT